MTPNCDTCLNAKISQAVRLWASLSLPEDREEAWGHLVDLLNQEIREEESPCQSAEAMGNRGEGGNREP